jgi:hypothetical protein
MPSEFGFNHPSFLDFLRSQPPLENTGWGFMASNTTNNYKFGGDTPVCQHDQPLRMLYAKVAVCMDCGSQFEVTG